MKIEVPVSFKGVASIVVPDHLSAADGKLLAEKIIGIRIKADFWQSVLIDESPASEEYEGKCSTAAQATMDSDWTDACTGEVMGKWEIGESV